MKYMFLSNYLHLTLVVVSITSNLHYFGTGFKTKLYVSAMLMFIAGDAKG